MSYLRLVIAGMLLAFNTAFALNPVQGWYLGVMGGGTYAPKIDFTFVNPHTFANGTGQLTYSLGGNGGIFLGYLCNKFRFEGEALYNMNQFDKLELGTLVLKDHLTPNGVRIYGDTSFLAGFFNVLYDFYQPGVDVNLVPYVGLGLGFASIQNDFKLYSVYFNNGITPIFTAKETTSTPIGQAIIGLSYFLDDFAAAGMDFRFLGTRKIDALGKSFRAATFNINFTYALDW